MQRRRWTFWVVYILAFITSVGLLLFSYTQVDLSLTLSQRTIFQTIQKSFQYVGFYQRSTAASVYVLLLSLLTCLYIACVWGSITGKLKEKHVWSIVGLFSFFLLFSYPAAFSYDIFNYIFTAKTVLLYGKNPYVVKPLDFQGIDSMLSFMRWTHLPSAYTPLWISLTFLPYLLSFGNLFIAAITMKFIPIVFYLISIWSIAKILKKTNPTFVVLGMASFALNPLVIIEVLISAHNDIVMMGFALLAYQFFLEKRTALSFLLFSLSVAAKFITIFLLPLFYFKWSARKACVLLATALALVLLRREFLPWYLLWIIPFSVLIPNVPVLIILTGLSIGLLLRYTPVFYYGNYDNPVPLIQNVLLLTSISLSCILAVIFHSLSPKTSVKK